MKRFNPHKKGEDRSYGLTWQQLFGVAMLHGSTFSGRILKEYQRLLGEVRRNGKPEEVRS